MAFHKRSISNVLVEKVFKSFVGFPLRLPNKGTKVATQNTQSCMVQFESIWKQVKTDTTEQLSFDHLLLLCSIRMCNAIVRNDVKDSVLLQGYWESVQLTVQHTSNQQLFSEGLKSIQAHYLNHLCDLSIVIDQVSTRGSVVFHSSPHLSVSDLWLDKVVRNLEVGPV